MSRTPVPEVKKESPLLLKDLIVQVKKELTEAANARVANNEPSVFVLKNLTLEVHFLLEKSSSAEGSAGINILPILLGTKLAASNKSEQVHKVTLELGPYVEPGDGGDGGGESDNPPGGEGIEVIEVKIPSSENLPNLLQKKPLQLNSPKPSITFKKPVNS
jgi:hypothetical protein